MKLYQDMSAIHFKCDPVFFSAVKRGVKTAEVRLLSRREWADVQVQNPALMYLTEPESNETLTKGIGYVAPIGELLGSIVVLFCFSKDAA